MIIKHVQVKIDGRTHGMRIEIDVDAVANELARQLAGSGRARITRLDGAIVAGLTTKMVDIPPPPPTLKFPSQQETA